jgi:hypothetical protein
LLTSAGSSAEHTALLRLVLRDLRLLALLLRRDLRLVLRDLRLRRDLRPQWHCVTALQQQARAMHRECVSA